MSKKILIVDDEPGSILFLQQLLEEQGYEIFSCENSCDALDIIKSNDISVIFTDLMMPGMNGFELCKQIRDYKKDKFVWVCAITGFTTLLSNEESQKADFDEHFYKPFDLELIVETTNEAFQRMKLSQNS